MAVTFLAYFTSHYTNAPQHIITQVLILVQYQSWHYTHTTRHYTKIIRFTQIAADTLNYLTMAQHCPSLGNIAPSLCINRYVVILFPIHQSSLKEIELSLFWIWSEAQTNFNRALRKLYLSPKPIWNKAYFKGKWSQFQSQKSLFA